MVMPVIQLELAGVDAQERDKFDGGHEMGSNQQLVSPGDLITTDVGFMRGHGTYTKEDGLYASLAGVVQRVNKLISVTPLKTKYQGEIGDVVVGRITEVQQKRWKVNTNSRLDSVLLLSSVNLPGGELRRRSAEDELSMRKYLQEGDLISAEVQNVYHDGSLSLHTRSLKYGKLSQGTLIKVSPSLIKRRKTHFHKLPCGVSVILGNNGFVWVSPTEHEEEGGGSGGFSQNLSQVPTTDRTGIARVRNCILALAQNGVMLWDTTLANAYDACLKYPLTDLLKSDVMREIAFVTRQNLEHQ
ncbi:hypothetical protein TCAL_09194 [Tigriopus californicus]|uniref:Exosome complex component RRP4 n=1 Tax=Tigriopus californicus TaxID=6832 RepID=A0A553PAS7_TIGCA|nr:exosome complex component RRP4-like [Tigriopus californicus]TRY74768.1 hypothetical protein TCAL_09194 [Tigriopus californicus]|eukprot:TCALIF_09194-PA protein Name:"Similar to EXOSC2 Exosome complex component RRP4 (Bos taurus)" AED:0.01 eAED:0.01 QI:119/1/1/1/1/1/2/67/299